MAIAALVEQQSTAFDYVRRIGLERALFALISDLACKKLEISISGFSDEMLEKLQARSRVLNKGEKVIGLSARY